jgi:pyruvate,orthophosphate dikinase
MKDHVLLAKGQGASPGVASGPLALTQEAALAFARRGEPPIFVRDEMDASDVPAIKASSGVIIARGGITADGAVAARALGKPCIVGCSSLLVSGTALRAGDSTIPEGARLTIDGASGSIEVG